MSPTSGPTPPESGTATSGPTPPRRGTATGRRPDARTSPDRPVDLDLAALRRHADAHIPELSGPLTAALVLGGRSNLTYRLTDGTNHWVLRRPPRGGLTPSAHDVGREYRVLSALWGSGVPVARPVAFCDDTAVIGAPFSVVAWVDGVVPRTRADMAPYPRADVERCAFALVDHLAALHAVPYEQVGLGTLGRPDGYLRRQVARWHDQWTRVAARAVPDLDRLHTGLADAVPPESAAAIVHGDFRVDNAILAPDDLGQVRAIVDWEMATLGDPLADLALHLVYRDEAAEPVLGGSAAAQDPRTPSSDALAARYARTSGRDLTTLDFHLALGYFKCAVIAAGIHARYLTGVTHGEGFDQAGEALEPLAAAGLRALGRYRSSHRS